MSFEKRNDNESITGGVLPNTPSRNSTIFAYAKKRTTRIPKIVISLFLAFSAYLVLPLVDIPFFGLSLSAPIFFLIVLFTIFKTRSSNFKQYKVWFLLALTIWAGIFISALGNGLASGGKNFDSSGLGTTVQYLYWLIVFYITAFLASQMNLLQRVGNILGWSVFALALFRWYEGLFFGIIGGSTRLHFLSQNNYGFLFSSFSPFLLMMIFSQKSWKRLIAIVCNLILWGAIAINASRGSWVAIVLGLALSFIVISLNKPRLAVGLIGFLLMAAIFVGILWIAVPTFSRAIMERIDTFSSLDKDISYQIRELMVQKGLLLFQRSPVIGVGVGRFQEASVPLEIPPLLNYYSQSQYDKMSAHNSYLAFLAETGLAGSIPYGILLIILATKGGKAALWSLRKGLYWILAAYVGFIQMSVHMWVIDSLTNTSNWFIYGLVAATIMIKKKNISVK